MTLRLAVVVWAFIAAVFCFYPLLAHGQRTPTRTIIEKDAVSAKTTAMSCTTTAAKVPTTTMASRVSLCVYNEDATATIYLGGSTVTTANGLPILAKGYFCDDVRSQAYYCVAGATVAIRVLEN